MAVRVDDLAGGEQLPDLHELTAGGQHRHPRPRVHRQPCHIGRGEQADLCGAEQRAGPQHQVTRDDVLAGAADVAAPPGAAVDGHG
jgi:hypothetical protein